MDKDEDYHPRFYKSDDRKFLGVAGGIADYFGWDPLLVRVVIVCGVLLPVPFVIIGYFVLAFLAPREYEVRGRGHDRKAWRAANRDYWRNWADEHGMGRRHGRRARFRAREFRRKATEASAQFADAVGAPFGPRTVGDETTSGESRRGADQARAESRPAGGDAAHSSAQSSKKTAGGASGKLPLRVLVSRVKRRFADIDDRLQDLERAAVSGDVRLRKAFRDLEANSPGDSA